MPFNLSQIFGGWRGKKAASPQRNARGAPSENSLTPPRKKSELNSAAARPRLEFSSDAPRAKSEKSQIKNKSELARKILVSPHVSEKSVMLGEGNYVFKVAPSATKPLLKNAVEDRYGVNVECVNILAPRDKKRRRGASVGIKTGFKKAIIKLKAGQTISEF